MVMLRRLSWQDGRWHAELWDDGWRIFFLGGQMASKLTLDAMVRFLLDSGVDPELPDTVS